MAVIMLLIRTILIEQIIAPIVTKGIHFGAEKIGNHCAKRKQKKDSQDEDKTG